MAVGFPAKTNFATGDVLTATNMNDVTGTLNLLQETLYPAGRNKIINGDFNINQRAFTSVTANAAYTFDRYITTNGGTSGTSTYTPQTFTPGTAPVAGYEGKNLLQIVTASFANNDSWGGIAQHIESVRTFAGQTVVFSFWAKASSGTPKLGIRVQQFFGTGGSPSAVVNTYATITAITTSWVRYSATVAVPSISGKTVGTAGDDSFKISLIVSAGSTTFDGAFGSMLQNNTFQTWGWQVEAASTGSTASPFQTASGSIGGELALCQRYYYRDTANSAAYTWLGNAGFATSTTNILIPYRPPVTMRVQPTALEYSNVMVGDGVNNLVPSSVTMDANQSFSTTALSVTVTGATQFRPYGLRANNSSTAYIGWSSEL